MSRPIAINLDTCQDSEPEGQECGYCIFEELPNISTIRKMSMKADITLNEITVCLADSDTNLELHVTKKGCASCNKMIPSVKEEWVY